MKIYFNPVSKSTYVLKVNSYELLLFGVDLDLKEYCNRDRNYLYLDKNSSGKLIESPSIISICNENWIEITIENVTKYCLELPEIVFGVLHYYKGLTPKDRNKLYMAWELMK